MKTQLNKPTTNTPWNLEDALAWIHEHETLAALHGYHLGLTGSVLFTGFSSKDLDIIIYRHTGWGRHIVEPDELLELLGLTITFSSLEADFRYGTSAPDGKELYITTTIWHDVSRRIDVFFLL